MTGESTSSLAHTSVMTEEVLEWLDPKDGQVLLDATFGRGGHTRAILERSRPTGKVIGFDRDPDAAQVFHAFSSEFNGRFIGHHAAFSEVADILGPHTLVDGVLADLGVSSPQLDDPSRGFAFRFDAPLDMRMNPNEDTSTALDLMIELSEEELAQLIFELGDEPKSRRIARDIKAALDRNELSTTHQLRSLIHRVIRPERGHTDPATRTFQALRIAVNDELGELRKLLNQLPQVLKDGGVAVIISFHSLEDRLVKQFFSSDANLLVLTKKGLAPTEREAAENPRSRSARLRAARRKPRGLA